MGVTNKAMESPDEVMTFDLVQIQVMKMGDATVRRSTYQPGWRWSESIGPSAKTDSCQVHHVGFMVSGRLHVATNDGGETEIGAGEAYEIQPGHNGWVVGDEPVVSIEFSGKS